MWVRDIDSLQSSHDLFLGCFSIGLNNGETKGCGPDDGGHELFQNSVGQFGPFLRRRSAADHDLLSCGF